MSGAANDGAESISLPDGRKVGFRRYGVTTGRTMLYCHGLPGSRIEPSLLHAAAGRQGLHVIGLERPGYGVTSPLPGRRMGDEAGDAGALADHLGCNRFDVIGFSGGGPQALACAAHLPDRVDSVTLVGSWAPFGRAGLDGMLDGFRQLWELAQTDFEAFSHTLADAVEEAGGAYELLAGGAPKPDREILAGDEVERSYRRNLDEATRQGMTGMLEDAAAAVSDWSFDCADVPCPVRLFHGTRDGNAPVGMARWLARNLPRASLVEWPEAMHFEAFRRWDEILTGQAACRSTAGPATPRMTTHGR